MIAKWKNMGDTLGGYRCITLDSEGNEKALHGKYGFIWENTGGDPSRAYKAYLCLLGRNPKIITFSINDLEKHKTAIEAPVDPAQMTRLANRFKG